MEQVCKFVNKINKSCGIDTHGLEILLCHDFSTDFQDKTKGLTTYMMRTMKSNLNLISTKLDS
jgi:hypothetical protein